MHKRGGSPPPRCASPPEGIFFSMKDHKILGREILGRAVDSGGMDCISASVPEATLGLFIGVGGPRKGKPVGTLV
jgi:hypothetical protein